MHWPEWKSEKKAIGTHFVKRSAFKNKSEKRFSFQQPFKFVFATLVHIYLKRKSNKIHPFFFHISQKLKIAKILGMHFLLWRKIRPKFDSHPCEVNLSVFVCVYFFSIVSCHKAPLIYQLAMGCVQYSHYKSCFTAFRR